MSFKINFVRDDSRKSGAKSRHFGSPFLIQKQILKKPFYKLYVRLLVYNKWIKKSDLKTNSKKIKFQI